MPRSAADRAFGFKAKGLLRILEAADIGEVREALSQLDITVFSVFAAQALKDILLAPFVVIAELLDLFIARRSGISNSLIRLQSIVGAVILLLNQGAPGQNKDQVLELLFSMQEILAAEIVFQADIVGKIDAIKNEVPLIQEDVEIAINNIIAGKVVA